MPKCLVWLRVSSSFGDYLGSAHHVAIEVDAPDPDTAISYVAKSLSNLIAWERKISAQRSSLADDDKAHLFFGPTNEPGTP